MGYIKKRFKVVIGFPRHKFFVVVPTIFISIRKDYNSMMGVKILTIEFVWGMRGFAIFSYFERYINNNNNEQK